MPNERAFFASTTLAKKGGHFDERILDTINQGRRKLGARGQVSPPPNLLVEVGQIMPTALLRAPTNSDWVQKRTGQFIRALHDNFVAFLT